MQAGFDQIARADVRRDARARWRRPTDAEDWRGCRSTALRATLAEANPRSYPVQMALGRALRKAGQLDEAMQAFERAAALVPIATGKDSPHAQMAEIALEKKDRPRAIAELHGARRRRLRQRRSGAPARRAAEATRASTIRRSSGRSTSASSPSIRSTPRRTRRSAAWRCSANDADAASREFRTVLALGPVDQAAAHTDLAESYCKGGKRADAKKQTLAALEIAPSYERAQDLLLKTRRRRRARDGSGSPRLVLAGRRCSR